MYMGRFRFSFWYWRALYFCEFLKTSDLNFSSDCYWDAIYTKMPYACRGHFESPFIVLEILIDVSAAVVEFMDCMHRL